MNVQQFYHPVKKQGMKTPGTTYAATLPVKIFVHDYLKDYGFDGKCVLPAVEAMRILASSTIGHLPGTNIRYMLDASFDKFLYIRPGNDRIQAFNEITVDQNGLVMSKLITKSGSPLEHARISFSPGKRPDNTRPLDLASALEGICVQISSERLYKDYIPLGPSYRNVSGTVFVSEKGAITDVKASIHEPFAYPPGSSFPLDAAFHAACAWRLRNSESTWFPAGFKKRLVFHRMVPGKTYTVKITPVKITPVKITPLAFPEVFDIGIYERTTGLACESVLGVRMKADSGINDLRFGKESNLEHIAANCTDHCIIELNTVRDYAYKCLSGHEMIRFRKMLHKRGQSYLAARLSCKRLSRRLSGNDLCVPPEEITTVMPDLVRPCSPLTDKTMPFSCSVSHDERFAISAASTGRIGVDVERIAARALKSQRYYMSEQERADVSVSRLGQIEAALRIWTIKEAVSKALDINLPDCWKRVQVTNIGKNTSTGLVDGEEFKAIHDTIEDHLFTCINIM